LALQSAAERELRSLANMVDVVVTAYFRAQGHLVEGVPEEVLSNTIVRCRTA
jgi:hypothetical protein